MKKLIAILLSLVMVLGLFAGCGAAGSSNELGLVNDGELTVAISPDFAPMEFVIYNEKGEAEYAGFDVMLAEFIAKEMGKGAVSLRGKMIDAPIVLRAQRTIAMAQALGLGREEEV